MHTSTGSIAGYMAPTTPTAIDRSSLTHLMMAGKPRNKAKYQKEKQADSSAPLRILAMLISLALSPDCGQSARPAG